MISEIIIKIIQLRVKNFLLLYSHQRNVAIATAIETTAWSDGNELVGNISCNKVSSISTWLKTTIGLSLLKKHWTHILTKTAINVATQI